LKALRGKIAPFSFDSCKTADLASPQCGAFFCKKTTKPKNNACLVLISNFSYIINTSTTQTGENEMEMKIVKAYGSKPNGTEYVVWDVVAPDGYVYETFSLKRDAKAWIEACNKT
jgi:hypothetical protein